MPSARPPGWRLVAAGAEAMVIAVAHDLHRKEVGATAQDVAVKTQCRAGPFPVVAVGQMGPEFLEAARQAVDAVAQRVDRPDARVDVVEAGPVRVETAAVH